MKAFSVDIRNHDDGFLMVIVKRLPSNEHQYVSGDSEMFLATVNKDRPRWKALLMCMLECEGVTLNA